MISFRALVHVKEHRDARKHPLELPLDGRSLQVRAEQWAPLRPCPYLPEPPTWHCCQNHLVLSCLPDVADEEHPALPRSKCELWQQPGLLEQKNEHPLLAAQAIRGRSKDNEQHDHCDREQGGDDALSRREAQDPPHEVRIRYGVGEILKRLDQDRAGIREREQEHGHDGEDLIVEMAVRPHCECEHESGERGEEGSDEAEEALIRWDEQRPAGEDGALRKLDCCPVVALGLYVASTAIMMSTGSHSNCYRRQE